MKKKKFNKLKRGKRSKQKKQEKVNPKNSLKPLKNKYYITTVIKKKKMKMPKDMSIIQKVIFYI